MLNSEFNFVSTKEIAEIIRCHPKSVDLFRSQQKWIEGIHYVRYGRRILYNVELIKDLIQCGGNVESADHLNAIAYYNDSRLGNKRRKK